LSIIYMLALGAVYAAIAGLLVEAVLSVSRKPSWHMGHESRGSVESAERRRQSLAFVGNERRGKAAMADASEAVTPDEVGVRKRA